MAEGLGLFIRRDVGVDEPKFAILHRRIAFGDVGGVFAQGFHFGPFENDATLEVVLDSVIIARAPILGDHLVIRVILEFGHSAQIISQPRAVQWVTRFAKRREMAGPHTGFTFPRCVGSKTETGQVTSWGTAGDVRHSGGSFAKRRVYFGFGPSMSTQCRSAAAAQAGLWPLKCRKTLSQ